MAKYVTINEEKMREIIINQIISRYSGELNIKGNKTSRWWSDARTQENGTVMTITGSSNASRAGNGVQIDVTYNLSCQPR
ncbi:MAG: hypothetical protein J6Q39_06085 [Bacteroidales bacterium]|nr:hypothetical protein [Bacteroidales bacterium]